LGAGVLGFGFRVSGFMFGVSCLGFRVAGVGFQVSTFVFQISGREREGIGVGTCATSVSKRRSTTAFSRRRCNSSRRVCSSLEVLAHTGCETGCEVSEMILFLRIHVMGPKRAAHTLACQSPQKNAQIVESHRAASARPWRCWPAQAAKQDKYQAHAVSTGVPRS